MGDATTHAVVYSLNTKCVAETVGTMMGIYLGCSVIANALLPGAKGQSMGFGWISLGYGLAFYFPGVWFGHVSANLNPALCLADLIIGNMTVIEFFALSACEMVGAFLGGVLVWLHWLPHFKTVPEPPAPNAADNLLRKRDALPKNAIEISSYNPRPSGPAAKNQLAANLRSRLRRRQRGGGGASGDAAHALDSAQPNPGASASLSASQQLHAAASSGHGDGNESESALRHPGRAVMNATEDIGSGLASGVREWVSDFMYYAVHHDKFRPPENWKDKAPLMEGTGQRSGSLEGSQQTNGSGQRTGEDGERQTPRRGPLATVLEDEESGRWGFGGGGGGGGDLGMWAADDDWKPEEDRVMTRSTLNRTFQEEHLAMQVKLVSPAIYYGATNQNIPHQASSLPLSSIHSGSSAGHTGARTGAGAVEQSEIAPAPAPAPDAPPAPPPLAQVALALGGPPPPLAHPLEQSPHEQDALLHDPLGAESPSPFNALSARPFKSRAPIPLAMPLIPQQPQGAPPPSPLPTLVGAPSPSEGGTSLPEGGLELNPPPLLFPTQNEFEVSAAAALEEERQRVMALYQAAVIVDQNAKLSVFTTRPAIYAPPFNWLTEFMATIMLVVGIKLMVEQMSRQGLAGQALQPLYVGLFIACQVMGLGGTSGFSVNPARDLGPRIAHALLPIPNKGPSEWYYGWIPVTASLAGAAAGAGLFMAIRDAVWP